QMLQVNIPADDAFALRQAGAELTPGVDQATVAEGFPAIGMGSTLISGQYIALGLYGSGAQQYFPMRGASDRGERRGYDDQFSAGVAQCLIQLGKAHIVTDAQSQPAYGRIDTDETIAERVVPGF